MYLYESGKYKDFDEVWSVVSNQELWEGIEIKYLTELNLKTIFGQDAGVPSIGNITPVIISLNFLYAPLGSIIFGLE